MLFPPVAPFVYAAGVGMSGMQTATTLAEQYGQRGGNLLDTLNGTAAELTGLGDWHAALTNKDIISGQELGMSMDDRIKLAGGTLGSWAMGPIESAAGKVGEAAGGLGRRSLDAASASFAPGGT